jgi:hypothetical protein
MSCTVGRVGARLRGRRYVDSVEGAEGAEGAEFEPLVGGCMCGGVRFRVDEPLLGALYCHCKRCQRRGGTAFSMTALTAQGSFAVTDGQDLLRSYHPDGGYVKSFCSNCGSHTHTTNPDDDSIVAVRMGCLDGDPGIRPMVHQFTAYAMPYEPIPDDGLPRYPERLGEGEPEP